MVLLHALGEQSSSWDDVRTEFETDFRVVAIDLRGHGDSDWPGTYSFQLMADDVIGVLDQLDLERVTLVGHSLGGLVAYLVAEQQPSRIDRLVVEDAPPPYPRDRPLPDRPDGPLPFDWEVLLAVNSECISPDPAFWDQLGDITAPTLLIAGGPSSHIPLEKLEETAARIPACSMVTVPAGHHIHITRPAEFSAALWTFLRG